MIQSIEIGNKKIAVNDQELADAMVEKYAAKKKVKHNFNRRDEKSTAYFTHV